MCLVRDILEIKAWPFYMPCLWVHRSNNVHDENDWKLCKPLDVGSIRIEMAHGTACICFSRLASSSGAANNLDYWSCKMNHTSACILEGHAQATLDQLVLHE